ncbi:Holliday junction resolvase RuvX [Nanchangia anserum]|uniref:Holliday junction resolvase RuvX n=1 Tax=Nanchangia anserum TaxID=2692125 RepID=UPI001D10B6EA|nr:Holliday junction resolvase RuvX [Nanchangia anserum]
MVGVIVGIDVGKARIGVARCDPDGIMAVPVATVRVDQWGSHVDEVAELIEAARAAHVVIGMPRRLSGQLGEAATMALDFARELAAVTHADITMVDERMTSVSAHRDLRSAGLSSRHHRAVVDQQAAVIMVEHTLDTVRRTGSLPGTALSEWSDTSQEEAR